MIAINQNNGTAQRSIAVVGAGIAGLTCALALSRAGHDVVVIDKGRAPGGRIATRLTRGFSFDHGAQYATATTPAFSAFLADTELAGTAAPWNGVIAHSDGGAAHSSNSQDQSKTRWVGVPGMRSLVEYLAAPVDVVSSVRVEAVTPVHGGWRLTTDDGNEYYNAGTVVIAVPAPQAVDLLVASEMLASAAADVVIDPCWAVMLAFDRRLDMPFDAGFVSQGPLAWIARNSSKPGRDATDTWILHASPTWSQSFLEADREIIISEMRRAFENVGATPGSKPVYETAHRWRYARVSRPVGTECLYDADMQIGACGDWLLGGKIEAAFLSGRALADRIIAEHSRSASDDKPVKVS